MIILHIYKRLWIFVSNLSASFIWKPIEQMIEDISYGIIPFWRDQQDMIRFLLIYQKEGFWGFPKGHKEGNESDIDAAKRELQEET